MQLSVSYDVSPRTASVRAQMIRDHFGLGLEPTRHVIAEDFELPVRAGQVVLFTGESGSGKSSLMRAAAGQLQMAGEQIVNLDESILESRSLVDHIPLAFQDALQLLSACGLSEAQLLLRTPHELSDGQRYRFRLALAIAQKPQWVLADEFTATLDRRLARVIAGNLRRLATRHGIGCLVATTHNDIATDLAPDVHLVCRLDGQLQLQTTGAVAERPSLIPKKKASHSRPNCGSPPVPRPTGRTSLGGITAAITSG